MSESLQRMHDSIEKHMLLKHPFYRAWEDGTLPGAALKTYGWEYSRFISKIADGWRACGDDAIAEEEVEHHGLWLDFARSLGAEEVTSVAEVTKLADTCDTLFKDRASALGGLYAFEYQQPHTSTSKLDGLRRNYAALGADETYFEVHKDDFDEPAMLREMIERLPKDERERAVQACEIMCVRLWDALSGIMDKSQLN